jgi:hypothetical protein
MDEITVEGKRYLSARRAAQISDYTQDYIGQLCRGKELTAKKIGRSWFVSEDSLMDHLKEYKHQEWLKRRQLQKKQQQEHEQDDEISYESDEGPLNPTPQKGANEPDETTRSVPAEAGEMAAAAATESASASSGAPAANETDMAIYHERLDPPEHSLASDETEDGDVNRHLQENASVAAPGSDADVAAETQRPHTHGNSDDDAVELGDGIRARRIDRHRRTQRTQRPSQGSQQATGGIISDGIITNDTMCQSNHIVDLQQKKRETAQTAQPKHRQPKTMGIYPEGELPKTPERDEDTNEPTETTADSDVPQQSEASEIEYANDDIADTQNTEGASQAVHTPEQERELDESGDTTDVHAPSVEAEEYEHDALVRTEHSTVSAAKLTLLTGTTIGILAACGIVFALLEWHAQYAVAQDSSGPTQLEGIRIKQW